MLRGFPPHSDDAVQHTPPQGVSDTVERRAPGSGHPPPGPGGRFLRNERPATEAETPGQESTVNSGSPPETCASSVMSDSSSWPTSSATTGHTAEYPCSSTSVGFQVTIS